MTEFEEHEDMAISNETIADIVWAALEISDRDKGGSCISVDVQPCGGVILNMLLQDANQNISYQQYRIYSEEDADSLYKIFDRAIDLKNGIEPPERDYTLTTKEKIKRSARRIIRRLEEKLLWSQTA